MNIRKSILLMGLIVTGVIAGGFLSLVTSDGVVVTGAVCGGFLGGLLYYMIQMIASRRKKQNLPYDHMDEQHPTHHEIHQTHEAKVTGMQDNVMADIMHFPPLRR
jgi:membrane protein YqaA with SNARE-associated domain